MAKRTPPEPDPIPLGRPDCRGETKAGKPCRNKACAGSAYCSSHGGGKRRVGAPAKLDEGLINAIVEVVETGVTWNVAAQSVGISPTTLHGWRARGEDDLDNKKATVYASLVERLTRATAQSERALVDVIRAQGIVDWRAAAFILACRFPARWAKRDRAVDEAVDERAKPRTVTPPEPARDAILELLANATRPPAGQENTTT
jgi:hypothetical protein